VSTDPERETVLIGEPKERCPWDWEDVRGVIARGVVKLDEIRHCQFCGRFFWRREGHPRREETMGGRRFGTAACYRAWRQDEEWRLERLRE
jgi:hypothetical protein